MTKRRHPLKHNKPTTAERAFCREYVKDFNITRICESLNMSRHTAYQWLGYPHIQELIKDEMAKRATRTTLDMDRIIKELAVITQSDITDYFNNIGGKMLTLRDFNELTPEQTRCIQEVSETISDKGSIMIKLKLYSKLDAIKIVAQSLSTMIAQMREFMNMTDDTQATTSINGKPVKVINAPQKAPTLLEWENQMTEIEQMKDDQAVVMSGDNAEYIDAEYEEAVNNDDNDDN